MIGGSINALLYCLKTATPIFIPEPLVPFELNLTFRDYSFLGLEPSVELPYVWERLHFILSMSGLKLNSLPFNNWRTEDKQLIFITKNNKKITRDFNEIIHFDKEKKEYNVYDWFHVRSGKIHNFDLISGDLKFVNELIFHTPRDPRSYKGGKDVVAVSHMNEDDLANVDYSPGIVRLKVLNMMKGSGIRGKRNGFLNKDKGTYRYYALKIEHVFREVKPEIDSLYSIEEIMNMKQIKEEMWKNLLFPPQLSI